MMAKSDRIHGYPHNINGRIVVTMYHPAAALHQPDLKDAVIKDFMRLKQILAKPPESYPIQNQPEPILAKKEEPPEQLSLF